MITVVTGASGHVGANLVRGLLAADRAVRVMVRRDTRGVDGLDVERIEGDVRDPESLARAFAGADVVYHCAANISVDGSHGDDLVETNVDGPRNVVEAALEAGIRRLVHFSSIHALSEHPLDQPVTEANGLVAEDEPALPYSRSKAAGQREVLAGVQRGLDAVIINPSSVLGRHDYKLSYMGETIRDLAAGRLPALVPGGYDFVDVRDVVDTAIRAETRGRAGECYLVSGTYATVRELAALVGQAGGAPPPRWTCPMWLARCGAPFSVAWAKATGQRPKFTAASLQVLESNARTDHGKATGKLDHQPRPLAETIRDTLDWQRRAGFLKPS